MSPIYERNVVNSPSFYAETKLQNFISTYGKSLSSNHVLLRLTKKWKKSLDNRNFVGPVFMDLSKAFNCTLHDLLVAKLHAYGLSEKKTRCKKHRKQSVKINDTEMSFPNTFIGCTTRFCIRPYFIQYLHKWLFLFIKDVEPANFACGNTIYAARNNIEELIKVLEKENEPAIHV